jgi:hypothetical protein
MNRITRLLAIAGLGLGTALAIGASPAQAAGTTTTAIKSGTSTQQLYGWDDNEVVGYFRTLRSCERVGLVGEAHGRWDDYDCSRVGFGSYRRSWELSVSTDDWNGGWNNDNWFGGWYTNWHGGDWDNNWHGGGWGDTWHGGDRGDNWHRGDGGGN